MQKKNGNDGFRYRFFVFMFLTKEKLYRCFRLPESEEFP